MEAIGVIGPFKRGILGGFIEITEKKMETTI